MADLCKIVGRKTPYTHTVIVVVTFIYNEHLLVVVAFQPVVAHINKIASNNIYTFTTAAICVCEQKVVA